MKLRSEVAIQICFIPEHISLPLLLYFIKQLESLERKHTSCHRCLVLLFLFLVSVFRRTDQSFNLCFDVLLLNTRVSSTGLISLDTLTKGFVRDALLVGTQKHVGCGMLCALSYL